MPAHRSTVLLHHAILPSHTWSFIPALKG